DSAEASAEANANEESNEDSVKVKLEQEEINGLRQKAGGFSFLKNSELKLTLTGR
ncbi:hypothetical protein L195_g043153, partial [Trifolium pratense]